MQTRLTFQLYSCREDSPNTFVNWVKFRYVSFSQLIDKYIIMKT